MEKQESRIFGCWMGGLPIDVREKTIHAYGDTAVVHILLSFKGLLDGKPFGPIDLRRTVVRVTQQGSWKIVAWQVTHVESK